MACAYEVVKHVVRHDLPARAKALEPVMTECLEGLADRHRSVQQARAIGLFGCADLVDADGRAVQPLQVRKSAGRKPPDELSSLQDELSSPIFLS